MIVCFDCNDTLKFSYKGQAYQYKYDDLMAHLIEEEYVERNYGDTVWAQEITGGFMKGSFFVRYPDGKTEILYAPFFKAKYRYAG